MTMGECSTNSRLPVDSKVKFAAWPTSWRPPGADQLFHLDDPSELAHKALQRRQHYKYCPGAIIFISFSLSSTHPASWKLEQVLERLQRYTRQRPNATVTVGISQQSSSHVS